VDRVEERSAVSDRSPIEWTDATWNPVRGCSKISPGCRFCYAEVFAERFRGVPGHPFEQGFDLRLVPEKLYQPLSWVRPRKIFVNSMSDLFHEAIDDDYVAQVIEVMKAADWHTFQVLTKRAQRMADFIAERSPGLAAFEHIWLGVSVENRKHGLPRIAELRRTLAGVRFLSVEPLLEDLGEIDLDSIDWVIVGGESGRSARPMRAEWVEAIRVQCHEAGVPFFFKQWGGRRKKEAGRELNGTTYDAFPEVAAVASPSREERGRRRIRLESMMDRGRQWTGTTTRGASRAG